jgi:hypothetical protein
MRPSSNASDGSTRFYSGELPHLDVKKLGRISVKGAGHRITGHRTESSREPRFGGGEVESVAV